ncbi:MAG: MMPL family transporter [Thermodesulfobacteriota bacterium]
MKKFLLKPVIFSVDHPKVVAALYLVLTFLFAVQIPSIRIDTDPENMLSAEEPVRIAHEEVKRDFFLHDTIVLGVVDSASSDGPFTPATLENIARITDEILKIDGVIARDVISPTTTDDIRGEGGLLTIEPLMGRTVKSPEAAREVRDRALANPILKDLLVAADGEAITIFIPIEQKDQSHRISKEIRAITERHGGGSETYHMAGLPVAEDTFGTEMFKQMGISAPLAGFLIFLLMLFFFRAPLLVLSSMAVAMMTVLWAMGFLIGAGFTVHIMSSMIPIFLMPIAVVDSIHLLSEFHDRLPSAGDRKKAILEVTDELFVPMLFTSVTSAVGFASLLFTPIPPVRVFGGFISFGILAAWIMTITLLPAFIMLLPEKALKRFKGRAEGAGGAAYRFQQGLGRFAVKRAKSILVACTLLVAVSVYGISLTVVNDNPVRWFHSDHPIRVADRVLNSHFGGTYMAYLVFEGEEGGEVMKEPETLAYIERLQRELASVDVVGKTTSIVDVIKKVSFELHDGDPAYNALPDTPEKVAQYLFLYEMSGDPDDLYHLVDPSYEKANVWVQLTSGDNRDMKRVEEFATAYMEKNPPPGMESRWAGLTYLNVVWQEKMVAGMLRALAGSAVTVFIIMALLFRAPLWGLISMVPLTMTITLIYGLVGMSGKYYDMPIAVLSALTLGISIDFAIHLCQRTRQIRAGAPDWDVTVGRLFDEPVRAILRNVVVIAVGFLPLLLSPLVPYKTVGVFFAAIMAVSGFATLLLLPALMALLRSRLKL